DIPRKRPLKSPPLGAFEVSFPRNDIRSRAEFTAELEILTNTWLISSSKRIAPINIMINIENQRRYSAKKPKEATALMRMPIRVKVMDMPVTIASGLYLLPTEPDNTAGSMGRMQGVITVASPAMKTNNTDGAAGINKCPYISIP
ncbi:MAG: hypothetical protein KKA10_09185, partial [Euryarchaeota archaeon]|nr:hypothetical protein [Euryarchaeota archaeon]